MTKGLSLLMTILVFSSFFYGQEKSIPVNLSVFNEATAIPFASFFSNPIHLGLQVGTEFNYTEKIHTRFFQTVNINYYYHAYLNHGMGLFTEIGYEYRTKIGFSLTGLLGVGYLHTFATSEEFTFDNGEYEKKTDRGNARLYPSFSIDIGFYPKKNKTSPKFFLRYQSWLEYPYSPGFIPMMTHVNLHLGTKFFILTHSSKK